MQALRATKLTRSLPLRFWFLCIISGVWARSLWIPRLAQAVGSRSEVVEKRQKQHHISSITVEEAPKHYTKYRTSWKGRILLKQKNAIKIVENRLTLSISFIFWKNNSSLPRLYSNPALEPNVRTVGLESVGCRRGGGTWKSQMQAPKACAGFGSFLGQQSSTSLRVMCQSGVSINSQFAFLFHDFAPPGPPS